MLRGHRRLLCDADSEVERGGNARYREVNAEVPVHVLQVNQERSQQLVSGLKLLTEPLKTLHHCAATFGTARADGGASVETEFLLPRRNIGVAEFLYHSTAVRES